MWLEFREGVVREFKNPASLVGAVLEEEVMERLTDPGKASELREEAADEVETVWPTVERARGFEEKAASVRVFSGMLQVIGCDVGEVCHNQLR